MTISESLKSKIKFENHLLTVRGIPIYNRFGNWFVLFKDELREINYSCNDDINAIVRELREIGLPINDALVPVALYMYHYDEFRTKRLSNLIKDKSMLKKRNSQNEFVLNVCKLLPYLVEKGYPIATDYFEERIKNNLKLKCYQIKAVASGVDVPAKINCINCEWGKKYARKGIIL